MSVIERVPVSFERVDTFADTTRAAYERVKAKAFEYYVSRGSVEGFDQEDWFRAETMLILKPDVIARRFNEDVFIEIMLPGCLPEELHLQINPNGMLVCTEPNADEQQVFRIAHFPEPVDMDTIDVEFVGEALRVTATVSDHDDLSYRRHTA